MKLQEVFRVLYRETATAHLLTQHTLFFLYPTLYPHLSKSLARLNWMQHPVTKCGEAGFHSCGESFSPSRNNSSFESEGSASVKGVCFDAREIPNKQQERSRVLKEKFPIRSAEPKLKAVSFRVTREYYDQYAAGKKHFEIRPWAPHWRSRLLPGGKPPAIAVVHTPGQPALRYEILDISFYSRLQVIEDGLISQEAYDELIKTEDCIVTWMGELLKFKEVIALSLFDFGEQCRDCKKQLQFRLIENEKLEKFCPICGYRRETLWRV